MAAESGGEHRDVMSVEVEEQPIDLSRVQKKQMPPLIPISMLRSSVVKQMPRLNPICGEWTIPDKDGERDKPRKRIRQGDDIERESWSRQKLDRARSVPQLTPLTSTLERNKSLSESRLPAAIETNHQNPTSVVNEEFLHSSWVYIGYYTQLLHRFQAQEMLRRCPTNNEADIPSDEQNPEEVSEIHQEESCDPKPRQSRPLTGKHVRTGTGASPATLLTLRRKIEARRQQQLRN